MIVLFSHQKGGVGKSTTAINLAYSSQKYFNDIVILDLDSQHSSKLFNDLRESQKKKTIECLTIKSPKIKETIKKYSKNKENLLIIDSGGFDSDINRESLLRADIIITPVGISQIEIFGLQKYKAMLKSASKAISKNIKTNVLLNNIDGRSKTKLKELKEYIKSNQSSFNLLNTVIHTRADYKNSYGDGLTVQEYNKKSEATEEIKLFAKEIKQLIKNS